MKIYKIEDILDPFSGFFFTDVGLGTRRVLLDHFVADNNLEEHSCIIFVYKGLEFTGTVRWNNCSWYIQDFQLI